MHLPLHRHTHALVLACACALTLFLPIAGAQPAHALDKDIRINEDVRIERDGRTQYRVTVTDESQTITEDTCTALPFVQEWSIVDFSTSKYYSRCEITTDFNRHVNPYIGVDSNGNVTFAAKQVTLDDLGLTFPNDASVTSRRFSLSGTYFRGTKATPGAALDRSEYSDTVTWENASALVLGAEGTLEQNDYFRTQERQEYKGIAAADMPTDLQALQTSSSPRPTWRATGALPTPSLLTSSIGKYFMFGIIAIVFGAIGLVRRANKKRREQETSGFVIPTAYQPSTPTSASQTKNPFALSADEVSVPSAEHSTPSAVEPPSSTQGPTNPYAPPSN